MLDRQLRIPATATGEPGESGLSPYGPPVRSLLQKFIDQRLARTRYEDSLNAGRDYSADLYEFFINHLRHPYGVCLMLTVSMVIYTNRRRLSPRRNGGSSDNSMSGSRAAQRQPKGDDMKVLPFTRRAAQTGVKTRVTGWRALKQAQVMGALAGLVGGVVVGLFGAILTAASWFVTNEGARHLFSTTGTALLFLTIPLLIFGGYCLDWMEKDTPRLYPKVVRYEGEGVGQ
jgi:hypothetical protein